MNEWLDWGKVGGDGKMSTEMVRRKVGNTGFTVVNKNSSLVTESVAVLYITNSDGNTTYSFSSSMWQMQNI